MVENGNELVSIENDYLLEIAESAEKRIQAIKRIKNVVLKITAASDWTDQNDKPYLAGSGCFKVARIFGIGWTFIGDPVKVREEDGHFRYDVKLSVFMKGQVIEVIGSRSSRDPFFTTRYRNGQKVELSPSELDAGDVLKASITNAQAIGITVILGLKGLSWTDLEEGGIRKDAVTKIQYKKKGEDHKKDAKPLDNTGQDAPDRQDAPGQEIPPTPNQDPSPKVISQAQAKRFYAIAKGTGVADDVIKTWLKSNYSLTSTKDIPLAKYDEICKAAEEQLPEFAQEPGMEG